MLRGGRPIYRPLMRKEILAAELHHITATSEPRPHRAQQSPRLRVICNTSNCSLPTGVSDFSVLLVLRVWEISKKPTLVIVGNALAYTQLLQRTK